MTMVLPNCSGFAPRLQDWFQSVGREYPWRQSTDPYAVLVAVFMLQRTGVSQVMNVYAGFLQRYPDVGTLAAADDGELAEALRPLGRTSRLPVLRALARTIWEKHDGLIPSDLESLDALPGLGQYSARAVLCLAYDRPYIMLDPNSYRVLARACGVVSSKARPHTDRPLIEALDSLVPLDGPRAFNLALLDVGATICRARKPRHEVCPLLDVCRSVRGGSG